MKLNIPPECQTVEYKSNINIETLKKEIAAMSNSVPNREALNNKCSIYLFVTDNGETIHNNSIKKEDYDYLAELENWMKTEEIKYSIHEEGDSDKYLVIDFFAKLGTIIILNENEIYARICSTTTLADIHTARALYTSKDIVLPLKTSTKYNIINFQELENQVLNFLHINLTIDWMFSHQLVDDTKSKYLTSYGLWLSDLSNRKIIINNNEYTGSVFKLYQIFIDNIEPWLNKEPIVDKIYSTRNRNKNIVSATVLREIFFNAVAHSTICNEHYCIIEYDNNKITFKNSHIYNKKIMDAFHSNKVPPTVPNNQIWFDAIRNLKLVEGSNYGLNEIKKEAFENSYMVAIKYDSSQFELNIITGEEEKASLRKKKGKYIIWEK